MEEVPRPIQQSLYSFTFSLSINQVMDFFRSIDCNKTRCTFYENAWIVPIVHQHMCLICINCTILWLVNVCMSI